MNRHAGQVRQAKSLLQRGLLARAENICASLLKLNPADAAALEVLAEVRNRQGAPAESVEILQRLVALRPGDTQALLQLCKMLGLAGRGAEALETCDRLVEVAPLLIDAHLQRGWLLLSRGRHLECIAACDAALAIDPDQVDALLRRGVAQQALSRWNEALADYDKVIALQPDCTDALNNAGIVLAAKGEAEAAIVRYDRALAIRAGLPEALNNRGVALKVLGRAEEALASFSAASRLKPDYFAALKNQAEVLVMLQRHADALACYDRALDVQPGDPVLHKNRGAMLQALGRYQEALLGTERALSLQPNNPDAFNNRGVILGALGRHADAAQSFRAALALDPNNVNAHWNLSLCLLRQGQFEEGWREHEWRWKKADFFQHNYNFRQPQWQGREDIKGRTILLSAEQGLGDAIQFVRYVRLVEERGAKVRLLVSDPLLELFSASFPGAHVFSKAAELPAFDFHCPLLSLPLAFATRLETIPASVPYLSAPISSLAAWEAKWPATEFKQIGLVWSGNARHANDANRSIPLRSLAPLLNSDNCHFFSLQKELGPEDRAWLEGFPQVSILAEQLKDFADTAAVISMLDLVITVDTAVAHLAGALGKPVWILLPFVSDWRWPPGRTDSPWYPTARLYWQPAAGNWRHPIDQAASDLQGFLPTPRLHSTENPRAMGTTDAMKTALAMHNSGNLADAVAIYEGILQVQPDDFDATHMLGVVRLQQKRFDEAARLVERALAQHPDNRVALSNLASALRQGGEHEKAVAVYDRLTLLTPNNPEIWSNRAVSLIALRRNEEALVSVDSALALKWDHVTALNNRGAVLIQLGRHGEALACLDQLLEIKPGYSDAISNRSLALLGLGRPLEAVAVLRDALSRNPRQASLLNNLGISMMALNRHQEALASFADAISIDPDFVDANWNESLARLTVGDYAAGWRQYEWRWKRPEFAPHKRQFHLPQWTGEQDIRGRTLFLHFEQGLGDTIQFVRYIKLLESMGASVLLAVPETLRSLMTASFPDVRVFCGGEVLPPFDLHCPLLSLPLAFGTTADTIPSADPPYLRVPVERLEAWGRRLKTGGDIRVGIVWSGNPAHKSDRSRSFAAADLRPLLSLPGFRFYGLQKDVREADVEIMESLPRIELLGAEFADFADTAAVIPHMDLVISVDTSVAHLAGAMGKPVWIWLAFAADWRWLVGREDSPWYPTARLFRERTVSARAELIERTVAALGELHILAGRGKPQ
ncbi:MAG: tetratricopeptide repeat protein [Rhodocyclales bacterium]|nr:tetratricopeptide repeat protein [Rhodocyclales bacterium]